MRKFVNQIVLLCIMLVLAVACTNDNSVGESIRPSEDDIIQAVDTFHVKSSDVFDIVMSAQADSMFLGEFYSPVFGTTKAELMVQLAPPEDYEFPADEYKPEPDSLVLAMFYNSWYGARNTPVEISVYEINKQKIEYNKQYLSNLNAEDFTDFTVLMGKKLVTSVDLSVPDSVSGQEGYVPSVRYKFDDDQLKRFYDIAKSPHATADEFLDHFKGMYITSKYGASTVFNFFQINMKLYYHYTYEKNGKDTVVNTTILYPANKEVRQLNRFIHADLKEVVQTNDSVNYIKAAAGIYTKASIPVGRICKKIKNRLGNKELHVSGATLQVELAEMEENKLDLSSPMYVMAITESEYEEFLKTYDVPTAVDTNAVIGSYSPGTNSYNINISYFLVKHLREIYNDGDPAEELDILLVPVELEQVVDANTGMVNVTRIRPQAKVGGARIRSGQNTYSPMRIELLYAGF